MRKKVLKIAKSAVVLVLCLILCACTRNTTTPTTNDTEAAKTKVDVMVLNGTTGFGMANLMDDAANGKTDLDYTFSIESDASNVMAALVNGTVDIAALPTNAASTAYNKTQGKVQILALNTLGVLYLVTDGSVAVNSMADLAGKTVYAPAQNPTFIFKQICQANGLTDVTIDNTYAQPADLNTAVASGEVSIAVLPEPMVTVAKSKNANLVVALDLTKQWDLVNPQGSLVQGCVVVGKDFAQENPDAVATFLAEYEASINAMKTDVEGTAAKIETYGIFTKAAVAAKAIPNCNTCFIAGQDMKTAMSDFLDIMFEVAPASIGGAVPADDFYYIVNE